MPPGTPVQVFSPFSSSWVSGFDVATADEDCYEVRRRSDDTVLPATFHVDDLSVSVLAAMRFPPCRNTRIREQRRCIRMSDRLRELRPEQRR
jgi:hypothetical protein